MEQGKVRMLANLIELNKIEVKLSKKSFDNMEKFIKAAKTETP